MESWPPNGLERVQACPACGGRDRVLLHVGLRDRVFYVAPGEWTQYACRACNAAFLDPRPTREAIGLAYQGYVTSRPPNVDDEAFFVSDSAVSRMRRMIRNGYLNARYGYSFTPATSAGRMLLPLFPRRRERADWWVRHLPIRRTILDAGCGNGEFLLRMARAGWEVHGLEPDPVASRVARAAGVPVTVATLEDAALPAGSFDVITMNHVIEHLHDPAAALANIHRTLVTDGLLWIATPNLGSAGHRIFHDRWLHLDPPRHLVLFYPTTLGQLLERSGFRPLRWFRACSARWSFANSAAVARDEPPFEDNTISGRLRFRAALADAITIAGGQHAEEFAVLARRE